MKYIVFDTETTGLPDDWNSRDPKDWPHITQISARMFEDGQVIQTLNHYIKIGDTPYGQEAIDKTGLTREFLNANGIPIEIAMGEFWKMYCFCEVIFGFNLSFDKLMVEMELTRFTPEPVELTKTGFCLMDSTKEFVGIWDANGWSFKRPKLEELYFKCFGRMPDEGQHNALFDVDLTAECLHHLIEKGILS